MALYKGIHAYGPEALAVYHGANGLTHIGDTLRHHVSNFKVGLVLATTMNDAAFAVTDTTLTVTSGAVFPQDITALKYRYILIPASSTYTVGSNDAYEILKITTVATNVLTVARAQLGTQAITHADASTVYFFTTFNRWVGFINQDATTALDITAGTEMEAGDVPSVTAFAGLNVTVYAPFTKIQLSAGEILAING